MERYEVRLLQRSGAVNASSRRGARQVEETMVWICRLGTPADMRMTSSPPALPQSVPEDAFTTTFLVVNWPSNSAGSL